MAPLAEILCGMTRLRLIHKGRRRKFFNPCKNDLKRNVHSLPGDAGADRPAAMRRGEDLEGKKTKWSNENKRIRHEKFSSDH